MRSPGRALSRVRGSSAHLSGAGCNAEGAFFFKTDLGWSIVVLGVMSNAEGFYLAGTVFCDLKINVLLCCGGMGLGLLASHV